MRPHAEQATVLGKDGSLDVWLNELPFNGKRHVLGLGGLLTPIPPRPKTCLKVPPAHAGKVSLEVLGRSRRSLFQRLSPAT